MIDRDAEVTKKKAARDIEIAQKLLDDFAATGFADGEERWENVTLGWNKGKATLSVKRRDGKVVSQSGPEGKAKWDLISETTRKKVEKGKPVLVHAIIKVKANDFAIVSIEEIV